MRIEYCKILLQPIYSLMLRHQTMDKLERVNRTTERKTVWMHQCLARQWLIFKATIDFVTMGECHGARENRKISNKLIEKKSFHDNNQWQQQMKRRKRFEHESSTLIVIIMKVVGLWMKHVWLNTNGIHISEIKSKNVIHSFYTWIRFDKRCVRTSGWPFSKWNQRLWLIVIYCNRVDPYCACILNLQFFIHWLFVNLCYLNRVYLFLFRLLLRVMLFGIYWISTK